MHLVFILLSFFCSINWTFYVPSWVPQIFWLFFFLFLLHSEKNLKCKPLWILMNAHKIFHHLQFNTLQNHCIAPPKPSHSPFIILSPNLQHLPTIALFLFPSVTFSRLSDEWNYTICSIWIWLSPLSTVHLRFIYLVACISNLSLSLLMNIPLYRYTMIHLSFHL